ncbi:ORF6C domain-containing protein [Staphylococcus haemolyticus]|uniref:ORF6C domain-containing protein n=1 Tax=Staphylococcus haemolyticus TaxID=1283 RepID=UPI001C1EC2E6|nr:ORF6C domain-containing protein [Staphylococcus haemolyticus]MBU6948692.1 ORF6C domain-containing protein [Staphylococcus haemolyticus]MBU7211523.1 ORF6C domain-containing protein [Staphylococcus haemolyticus]
MSNQIMELTRNQMENMVAQANSILQMYDEITEMKSEFRGLYDEIRKEFDDFRNTVPLTGPQADRLHSFCSRKGHQFTREYFGQQVSQELYSKKYGHLIRGIFTVIKKKYEVNKYNQVRSVDGENAIAFVESLTLDDLPINYKRLTDSQIDTAERHGDYGVLERLA